jgi:hypothetical protein
MPPTQIASVINCSIQTVLNILQLFREINNVIEREGCGRTSLNNRKRIPYNIIVHRMIENFMRYQWHNCFYIIYFFGNHNSKNQKNRKNADFLYLSIQDVFIVLKLFFNL